MWAVQYRVAGKRYSKVVGTNKKEAEKVLKEVERKLAARDPVLDARERLRSQISVKAYFKAYLSYSEANKRKGGHERDQTIVKFLVAFLEAEGYRWLPDVDPLVLENYKIELRKRGSVENANRHLHTLRHSFNHAVHLGHLRESPMKRVKDFPPEEEAPPRFFSEVELREILWACLMRSEDFYRTILFLASTGARISELESIDWEHVHLGRGFVRLPTRKKKGRVVWRTVPLSETLSWVLRRAKKRGRPLADTMEARRRLQRILGLLKVPHANIHTCRHTFASHLVSRGVSLYVVGKLLGHSNPATTQKYSHLTPSSLEVVSLLPY